MFDRSPDSPQVNTSERTEAASPRLHLMLFDLANTAFASARFDTPTALLDEDDSIQMSAAKRVETFHIRHGRRYGLPALKSLGFIPTDEPGVIASAVQTTYDNPVDFRKFVLHRYDLDGLHDHVQRLNEAGEGTLDTALIQSAFDRLPELRRFRSARPLDSEA